ncbi:peptide-methionine (R)-S-oxide reductase [Brucella abortus]|nr:peptide-methionine (R)-S-oxide reductase [Brucella abortus]
MTGRCPDEISKSAEAIAKLSAEQYRVTQENGTERLGTGEYLYNKEPGIYVDTCLWRTAFRFVGQI